MLAHEHAAHSHEEAPDEYPYSVVAVAVFRVVPEAEPGADRETHRVGCVGRIEAVQVACALECMEPPREHLAVQAGPEPLEEILGEVIQSLELDVFLNHYETEEDVNRKALQVEQAILNKQRINKDLEIKSGMLSVYQDFILKNIKSAHDNFRRITADELMFTDEIDCSDLFGGGNARERILIFEVNAALER